METGQWVVVTTQHNGVFTGRLVSEDTEHRKVVLSDVSNVSYWGGTEGFMRLATKGMIDTDKIWPNEPARRMVVPLYTSIVFCSEEAAASWEARLAQAT